MVTLRCLLTLVAVNGWFLHQLDINNAFLHGDLTEEVYMTLSPSFGNKGEPRVWQLHKSLYDLKQTFCQWLTNFSSTSL